MDNIQNLIEEKSKELARKHAAIIEYECKRVCEKYNVHPSQLILNYFPNNIIEININITHRFKIENIFINNE